MTLDDVAVLLAEGISNELRRPVELDRDTLMVQRIHRLKARDPAVWLDLDPLALEKLRDEIDEKVPPLKPSRGGTAMLVAALFSGAMNDLIAARAAAIAAVVRPHARRYAAGFRRAAPSPAPEPEEPKP